MGRTFEIGSPILYGQWTFCVLGETKCIQQYKTTSDWNIPNKSHRIEPNQIQYQWNRFFFLSSFHIFFPRSTSKFSESKYIKYHLKKERRSRKKNNSKNRRLSTISMKNEIKRSTEQWTNVPKQNQTKVYEKKPEIRTPEIGSGSTNENK